MGHCVTQGLRPFRGQASDADLESPLTCPNPEDNSPPVEFLPVMPGFSCNSCRFLTTSPKVAERHCRTAGHDARGARYTAVRLQTWLRSKFARYWIVREVDDTDETQTAGNGALEEMIAEYESELKDEETVRLRVGDTKEGLDRDNTWVKMTGWVRHFGSRDKLDIYEAAEWVRARAAKQRQVEDPDQARENTQLRQLAESFDREIERYCCRLDSVPRETLQLLASISPTVLEGKPFGRKGREASMAKYRSVGHRYLGFCFRAYKQGREEALERWAVRFTDEQWGLLGDLVYSLDDRAGSQDSGFFSDGEQVRDEVSEEAEQDCGQDDDEDYLSTNPEEAALDWAVYRFLVSSIKQNVGGNVYTSPLLCFCAALGIKKHPLGYAEPQLYTGMLAAIMWWARLVFLEAGFEDSPHDLDEVNVDALLAFRDEHAKWMCINTYTVVSNILNWMAYGKGHRKRTSGQPSIRWSEDGASLFHSGECIGVEDFKRTMRDLVAEAEGFLDRIMSGSWSKTSERLDMGRIVDSMVRLGAGQSFATSPKNEWLQPGPGKVMRLAGSKLWDGAHSRWKLQGAKKWLRWLRQFREAAMAVVSDILAPHGSEMASGK
ncbi:hypothetical protein HIM_10605 [Hirsutella minnesotensis 3608]|uniref:Uncharacterized protein n=1 Tax=Hirsutella minnesotensis 3608 TaxID=1043627 RepID=A0A0F8A224_9HYPO|nr:hypothetical protein HIM_10605 [Hirsutella minnesotensis 3608]